MLTIYNKGKVADLYEDQSKATLIVVMLLPSVYPVGGTKNMAPGEGDEEGRLMLP